MGEQRTSRLKRILQRVEEHVEDWRKRDAVLKAEADDMRDQMWAEAAERERLLAEAMESEEDGRASIEELTKEHRVVFVLHREEVVETLEDLASQGVAAAVLDGWLGYPAAIAGRVKNTDCNLGAAYVHASNRCCAWGQCGRPGYRNG